MKNLGLSVCVGCFSIAVSLLFVFAATGQSLSRAPVATVAQIFPLAGSTETIGGSRLTSGTCATGTATIAGATTDMVTAISPVTHPGAGIVWFGYVSSPNVVSVKVCAMLTATPAGSIYRVRVIQ